MPAAIQQVQPAGANWLVLSPTWSYGRSAPGNQLPLLALYPGQDAFWPDLAQTIQDAKTAGLNVAIRPTPRFFIGSGDWWTTAPRDLSWWQVWFEQYRTFALHHADLAARSKVQALILGGGWLSPALPGGLLPDGSPSGVPADAELRWLNLISEVRQHYKGQLVWAMPAGSIQSPPAFMSNIDRVMLDLSVPLAARSTACPGRRARSLDGRNALRVFQVLEGKPIILNVACPSAPTCRLRWIASSPPWTPQWPRLAQWLRLRRLLPRRRYARWLLLDPWQARQRAIGSLVPPAANSALKLSLRAQQSNPILAMQVDHLFFNRSHRSIRFF